MITFIMLVIAIIAIAMTCLFGALFAGNWLLVVFGDFIVFGLIVWLIVKIIKRLKKK